MKNLKVKDKKTGQEGYIGHSTEVLPDKSYYVRFKGNGGGYVGRFCNGKDVERIG